MNVSLKNVKPKLSSKGDFGLFLAIEKGKKSGFVSEEKVMEVLRRIQGKI